MNKALIRNPDGIDLRSAAEVLPEHSHRSSCERPCVFDGEKYVTDDDFDILREKYLQGRCSLVLKFETVVSDKRAGYVYQVCYTALPDSSRTAITHDLLQVNPSGVDNIEDFSDAYNGDNPLVLSYLIKKVKVGEADIPSLVTTYFLNQNLSHIGTERGFSFAQGRDQFFLAFPDSQAGPPIDLDAAQPHPFDIGEVKSRSEAVYCLPKNQWELFRQLPGYFELYDTVPRLRVGIDKEGIKIAFQECAHHALKLSDTLIGPLDF